MQRSPGVSESVCRFQLRPIRRLVSFVGLLLPTAANGQQKLNCRRALIAVVVLIALQTNAALMAVADDSAPRTKPNIVFIFADDWGWGDLSCHGHPWAKTPNLDRIAAEGIDFQMFNVLNPVCSPSRSALMTGRFPARYAVHQHFATLAQNRDRNMPDWLDPKAPTLPRMLKPAGYRTGHFGKWHLTSRNVPDAPSPQAYGIDEALVFNGGADWPDAEMHETGDNAAKFILANRERPFFVNVWLHESHLPHYPSAESLALHKQLDERERIYAAVISDGDTAVGKVLNALKAAGVEQNTIVLFSSDNGPESTGRESDKKMGNQNTDRPGFGGYYSIGSTGGLRGRKRSLFEGGVRVPFLVRWPGHTPAGTKNDTTAFSGVDLLPTLCAAAGVALPSDNQGDGENLLAALHGQPIARTRPIFWEWDGRNAEPDWWPRLAVRDGDWKLLLTADAKRVALHRVTTDRAEATDVSKDNPAVVERLTKLALDWKKTLPAKPNPDCISKSRTAEDSAPAKKPQPANAQPAPAKKATPEQRAAAFARFDKNNDGHLTLDEYQAGLKGQPNLEQRFKSFDKNNDGKVTREEFGAPRSPDSTQDRQDDCGVSADVTGEFAGKKTHESNSQTP